MINTLYAMDLLGTPLAFGAALLIGSAFGAVLERAGFGSSRRLSAIFYFRDMTVLKVMFSAVLVAMLGLCYMSHAGLIDAGSISLPDTVYGAQIVGGLLFGIGFVMGGWCPGTAAVGLASGRLDALLFLIGAVLGSVLFNELFGFVKPLYTMGYSGTVFIYDTLGLAKGTFVLGFTIAGIVAFWASEFIEARMGNGRLDRNAAPLWVFTILLLITAGTYYSLPPAAPNAAPAAQPPSAGSAEPRHPVVATGRSDLEQHLLAIETGEDHIDPAQLADRLMSGATGLQLIDIRSAEEYAAFHLRGAVNMPLPELALWLDELRNAETVVVYSRGMTHAAQARDALAQAGIPNALLLTDGLEGFFRTCLKPVSLRAEPVSEAFAGRIREWRRYFLTSSDRRAAQPLPAAAPAHGPGLISAERLAAILTEPNLRIIDTRPQPEYNTSHAPGAVALNPESLRGVVGGIPSMLLPADLLARQFGALGISPETHVVIIHGDKVHDVTLVAMGLERLGHTHYSILDGGWQRWHAEGRPSDTRLPRITETVYPVPPADGFTVGAETVLAASGDGATRIIDVRPAPFFTGKASDEARAGHIPGAVNRPYTLDLASGTAGFASISDLAKTYESFVPMRDSRVIVHCRTGHQASQTWFVLRRLLGYTNVLWYDAGWTEWSARPELPVATGNK